jgi:hypothetical protein
MTGKTPRKAGDLTRGGTRPAALKCLLEGFGLPVSYDRLREACQTVVDEAAIHTVSWGSSSSASAP